MRDQVTVSNLTFHTPDIQQRRLKYIWHPLKLLTIIDPSANMDNLYIFKITFHVCVKCNLSVR